MTPTATPTAPAGPTPTSTPTATATPRSPFPIELEASWNMVSLPFAPAEPFRASDLVASLQENGFELRHIAVWRQGTWRP